ncbi:MAG: ahpC [Chlamydiales bacterium]|jgi:peroxiredoxin (alkyl hydroperoxide reductase subunit C)|nr:ahpC [Chlamydiales bacterium]
MGVLVGRKAPDFSVSAVVGQNVVPNYTLSSFRGKYVVLFFYPLDFTFVCPTELHAFQEALDAFEERNVQVIGCSVDSCYSHLAWLNTPKSKGGIEGVTYPILSDLNKTIASDYGVLHPQEGVAFRGLFLIDPEGVVRHQVVNDLPLGRSVEETLRMVDALAFFEENGEVCPANWRRGQKAMKPNCQGLTDYFQD